MENKYFESEKISNHVTRIRGASAELMYLIEGDKKAFLVDTGIGLGNLKTYIESITNLDVTVILSHGHLDHIGGSTYFNEVYMSHKDISLAQEHINYDIRRAYLDSMNINYEEIDFSPENLPQFINLKNGDTFDLGQLTLEIYTVAGHTQGSVIILIKEERAVIFGDDCNNFTFMFDTTCPSLSDYAKNLLKLKEHENKWDKIYLSHGTGDAPKILLDEVIELTEEIRNRNVDDVPFNFMGRVVQIAKKVNRDMSRVDGKFGNIVYDKNRI